jgi:adenine-specific DNA-methyltransferase
MPTLNWLTREADLQAAAKTEYRLLEEVQKCSYGDADTGNLIVQGDNLEALKALLPFYAGQVKCIYIARCLIKNDTEKGKCLILKMTPKN